MTRHNLPGGRDHRVNRRSGKRARGVTQGGEPLSSEGARYRKMADKVPAREAVRVPAKKGVVVRCKRIQRVGSGSRKARQRPRSANREDRVRVTICGLPTVTTRQLRRECNVRAQGHQGHYITDSPALATAC